MSKRTPIPEYVDQRGPKVEAGTVKVYKGGTTLRIPQDLLSQLGVNVEMKGDAVGDRFKFMASVKKEESLLVLTCVPEDYAPPQGRSLYVTWKSNPKSASVLLSLTGILPFLGMSEGDVENGVFRAKVIGKAIHVYFDEEVSS